MGLWSDHLFPRLVARGMRGEAFARLRRETLAPVAGTVLELGFGAGLNLPHYTAGEGGVRELLALEPAAVNRRLAATRVAASPFPVRWVGLRGEEIPLDAGAVDVVVSTWTMCTIGDLGAALGEVRRVLKPGGRLVFLEHGLSPDPEVARKQHRWNGVQRRLAAGCNLDRDFRALLECARFSIGALDHPTGLKGPRAVTYLYRGVATPQ